MGARSAGHAAVQRTCSSHVSSALHSQGYCTFFVTCSHLCPDKVEKVCLCIAGQAQARAVPVTMNEMLLRGCTLKNTGHILGLAVYTGNETRIQKNSAKTPNKIGKSSSAGRLKDAEHACFVSKWFAMLRCSAHVFACVQLLLQGMLGSASVAVVMN